MVCGSHRFDKMVCGLYRVQIRWFVVYTGLIRLLVQIRWFVEMS